MDVSTPTKPQTQSQSPKNDIGSSKNGQSPESAPITVGEFVELASDGKVSEKQIHEFLNQFPALAQKFGNLTGQAERAWLLKIFQVNRLFGEAALRHIEKMKTELAGPSPTAMETLLIDRIVVCYLGVQHGEIAAATGESKLGIHVLKFLVVQAESANRRFLAAMKSLAIVRRLTNGLNIQISHNYDAAARGGSSATDREKDLHRRREEIHAGLERATAEERELISIGAT